jgi:hypothetical protein
MKQPKINRNIRLIIKKSIADYLNDYICNHSGFHNITIASINKVSEMLSLKVCKTVSSHYKDFYFYNDTCNNCEYGQDSPICDKTAGELCDNGWCGLHKFSTCNTFRNIKQGKG